MRLFCYCLKDNNSSYNSDDDNNYPPEIGEEYNTSYSFPKYDSVHTDEEYVRECCKCTIL